MSASLLAGLLILAGGLAAGCSSVPLESLADDADLAVKLDANARAVMPNHRIKFFVDLTNDTSRAVDVQELSIELRASPRLEPRSVTLRQTWSYRGLPLPELAPGKRLTVPILPEKGAEFPLERLSPGEYRIVAVVNERFESGPYDLRVHRPDLEGGMPRRGSTAPVGHRRLPGTVRTRGGQQAPASIRQAHRAREGQGWNR